MISGPVAANVIGRFPVALLLCSYFSSDANGLLLSNAYNTCLKTNGSPHLSEICSLCFVISHTHNKVLKWNGTKWSLNLGPFSLCRHFAI